MYDKDISKREKVFISYKDENDVTISGYVDLISTSESLVTISTDKNILKIPINSVIKIKQKKQK